MVVPSLYRWLSVFYAAMKDTNNEKQMKLINKRYPKIVIVMNIIGIIFFLIQDPMNVLIKISPLVDTNPSLFQTLSSIDFNLNNVLSGIISTLCISRYWLMLFNIYYNHEISKQKWMKYINPSNINNNFFIKYKSTFGSNSFIIKAALIISIIICIFNYAFINIFSTQACTNINCLNDITLYMEVVRITTVIPVLMIYFAIPTMLDDILLKYEIQCALIISAITIPIYTTFRVTCIAVGFDEIVSELMFRSCFHIFGRFMYLLSTTYWMLQKIESQCDEQNENNNTFLSRNDKLIDMFGDKLKFELFGKYLYEKGQHHLLLCFIEMLQFKCLVDRNVQQKQRKDSYKTTETGLIINQHWLDFQLFIQKSYVPKSSLIYNSQSHSHGILPRSLFIKIIYGLYRKYINTENIGSLQINISDGNRQKYDKNNIDFSTFNNANARMDKQELFKYFDIIIDEIYDLLQIDVDKIKIGSQYIEGEDDDDTETKCIQQNDSNVVCGGQIPSLYGVISDEKVEILHELWLVSKVKFYRQAHEFGLFDNQIDCLMEYFIKLKAK